MKIVHKNIGTGLIIATFSAVIIVCFLIDPIAQDLNYHNFSDIKGFSYLPNALNVLSNIPFILVGTIGLIAMNKQGKHSLNILSSNKLSYFFLFLGSVLVGFGSGYYHFNPSNETLVWDRIPMTIAFMGLYSIIISEFVSEKVGRLSLIPLIILGVFSVLYWWFTEAGGAGDLRFYAIVQFVPILIIPLMLIFYRSTFNDTNGYWILILTYVGAKVFETFDHQIHGYMGVISGHSIKHIVPALGLYYLIIRYKKRKYA